MDSKHNAQHPRDFSLDNWWQISRRVVDKVQQDNIGLIAAGVAFYFLLAIFPLMAALISLYGLFVEQQTLVQHINLLVGVIPEQSRSILETQFESLLATDNKTLSFGFISSFVLAIWSGGKGAIALVTACNITYQENKSRSFIRIIWIRLVLTFAAVFTMLLMLLLVVGIPILLNMFNERVQALFNWLTWPVLLFIFNCALAGLYRFAPHRESAKWRWVTLGATLATALWLLGSFLFNFYVKEYASYNETYGSMGSVIILLMWFYLTAYTILLGAEINAATELQTDKDTTTGEVKDKGKRGAYVADHSPDDINN